MSCCFGERPMTFVMRPASGVDRSRCATQRLGILYMPMDSSAPATNSSKPLSGQRTGERADAWLTFSAWIWVAYFIGLAAAVIWFVF